MLNHQLSPEGQAQRLGLQVVPRPGLSSCCLAPNLCRDAVNRQKTGKAQTEKPIMDSQDSDSATNWISSCKRYPETATNLAETATRHGKSSL